MFKICHYKYVRKTVDLLMSLNWVIWITTDAGRVRVLSNYKSGGWVIGWWLDHIDCQLVKQFTVKKYFHFPVSV